ncbi:MAG: 16S rRNA (uracil(1498)-N(3))-methyltransferase [Candidatus Margulisiibacteriota bacterium]
MNRFYVLPEFINENIIMITGQDVNHVKNVLRLKPEDELVCFDGKGTEYLCSITSIEKDLVKTRIISSKKADTEPAVKITLVQALPKSSKMDYIIQKAVELGVHKIIPVSTERTIAKGTKLERWKKIAKEASEQCGRAIIPEVSLTMNFNEFLCMSMNFDLKLIPWENEKQISLKSVLKKHSDAQNIALLIGPEGGFSAQEVKEAVEQGFKPVSLGKRILRAETAGVAAIAMITYEIS